MNHAHNGSRPTATLPAQLVLLMALAFFAHLAAPATLHAAGEGPKQVLLPEPHRMADRKLGLAIALHLQDRLQLCRGAEPTAGARARDLADQLGSAAVDMSHEQFWQAFTEQVDVDALVNLGFESVEQAPRPIVMVIATAEGRQQIELPRDANAKELAILAAGALAEALELSPADRALLTHTDIEDPEIFAAYHGVRHAYGKWPMNPYRSEMATLATLPARHSHWAFHLARLTAGAGYIAATTTRDSDSTDLRSAETFVRQGVAHLIGTPHEAQMYGDLLKLPRVEIGQALIGDVEKLLLEVAQPLTYGETLGGEGGGNNAGDLKAIDDFEAMLGDDAGGDMGLPGGAVDQPDMVGALTGGKTEYSHANRLGAVRVLGVIQSTQAKPVFEKLAKRSDPTVRTAVATAIRHYEDPAPFTALLGALAKDKAPAVRFAALQSQHQLGQTGVADALKSIANQRMTADDATAAQAQDAALQWIALADSGDIAQLKQLADHNDAKVRRAANVALAQQQPAGSDHYLAMLRSPSGEVVLHGIAELARGDVASARDALVRVAQEPNADIAWAARDALAPLRPSDRQGQLAFDLAIGHHYTRTQIVEQLAESNEPWARELLIKATSNSNAHARRAALNALASRDPAAARTAALEQLADPHRVVRTNAARHLAELAKAGDADAMRQAVADWSGNRFDEAGQIYAAQAIAKAQGEPAPQPRPAARSIAGKRNLSWLCGGTDPHSPYDAYYQLGADVSNGWKEAYAAGKIYFARIEPVGHPGILITRPDQSDYTFLTLQNQLNDSNMPWIDGVVYGEETMSMALDTIWPEAWRLFCQEAGIDPSTIDGEQENLSPIQKRAWNDWAHTRVIEGFNELYDLTRLIFDAKRPGLQVCTFMTEQKLLKTSAHTSEIDWKFDVGAIYHYIGHTRKDAYSLVRRIRTIWPDRPVLWLSNGIGVYERTPIKYTSKVPTEPIDTVRYRAYTDAMTAWSAGADTGWFSYWPFQEYDWVNKGMSSLRGITIKPENIYPDSPLLNRAIEYSFRGVEQKYRDDAERANASNKEIGLPDASANAAAGLDDLLPEELGGKPKVDQHAQRVIDEKAAFDLGFQFYRKYLFDLATLFRSLPRQTQHYDTLVIQPGLNVWYGSIGSPGSDLLSSYDFLLDINKTARLPLDRYRFIAVKDPGLLTDDAIAALSQWLRDTPGVLYVHGHLSDDNASEASTVVDLDGQLQNDWPWESDIKLSPVAQPDGKAAKAGPMTLAGSAGSLELNKATPTVTLNLLSSNARPLLSHNGQAMLAHWRHPDFKGHVVFDAIDTGQLSYRQTLRKQFNQLHQQQNVGIAITTPSRFEINRGEHITAVATAGSAESMQVQGVDVITGLHNPTVGPHKSAAMTLEQFQSPHVAAVNGITILSETPIESVEPVANGVRITTPGLFHAVSLKPLTVAPNVPRIKAEDVGHWIIHGQGQPGVGVQQTSDKDNTGQRTYIRAKGPVTITTN